MKTVLATAGLMCWAALTVFTSNIIFGCAKAGGTGSIVISSRESQDNGKLIGGDQGSLAGAGFDPSKPTKILIHGWFQNGTGRFFVTVKNALLDAEDLNVISVDWSKYAQAEYTVARDATPYVGAYTASFVDFLVQDVGVDMSTIHLIGFSLGAHIAGIVGETVKSGQLFWISGLDPAGPLYFQNNTIDQLDASDALFVDVIHTSGGTYGYKYPCGTVDFYPNGGHASQPGCLLNLHPFCSHLRAFLLYAESIFSRGFIGTQCNSYESYEKGECAKNVTAVMGYHVDKRSKGVFYLKTSSESPYAQQ